MSSLSLGSNFENITTGADGSIGRELNAAGVQAYATAVDGLNESQKRLLLTEQGLNETEIQQVLTRQQGIASGELISASVVKQVVSEVALTDAKKQELLATFEQEMATGMLTKERLIEIAAQEGEVGAVARLILARNAESGAIKLNTASLWENIKATLTWMATNPMGWIMGAVVAIAALTKAYKYFNPSTEELIKNLDESTSKLKEASNNIEDYKSKIEDTTSKIDELKKKIASGKFSIADKDELETLKQTNKELTEKLSLEQDSQIKASKKVIEDAKELKYKEPSFLEELLQPQEGEYDSFKSFERFITTAQNSLESLLSVYTFGLMDFETPYSEKELQWIEEDAEEKAKQEYQRIISIYQAYKTQIDAGLLDGSNLAWQDAKEEYEKLLYKNYKENPNKTSYSALSIKNKRSAAYTSLKKTGLFDVKTIGKITSQMTEEELNDFYDVDWSKVIIPDISKYDGDIKAWGKDVINAMNSHLVTEGKKNPFNINIFDMGSDNAPNALGNLRKELDSITESYQTLSSAMEEFRKNGNFSLSTIEKLMDSGSDWLKYINLENGELKINEESYNSLMAAKLEDLKIQALQNLEAQAMDITDKATAETYLKTQTDNLTSSYKDLTSAIKDRISAHLELLKVKALENGEDIGVYERAQKVLLDNSDKISALYDNANILVGTPDKSLSSTISSMKSTAELIDKTKEGVSEFGFIGRSQVEEIAAAYPTLESVLEDYINKKISEQDVIEALEGKYNEEVDIYRDAYVKRRQYDGAWYKNNVKLISEDLKNKVKSYNIDLDNYANYAKSKAEIELQIAETIAKLNSPNKGMSQYDDMFFANEEDNNRVRNEYESYYKEKLENLEKVKKEIGQIDNIFDPNLDLDDWGKEGSSSSTSEDKKIDFIEIAISRLERDITNLGNVAGDVFSEWSKRTSALGGEMSKVSDEIQLQQAAYSKYIEYANGVGLAEPYANMVRNGDLSILKTADDDLSSKINEYKEYYENALACADKVEELKIKQHELVKENFDNIVKQFENVQNEISSTISILEGYNSLIEAKGWFASEDIYKNIINEHNKTLNTLYSEREQLLNAFGNIPEETDAWYEMRQQINDINKNIIDTIVSIEEMNNKIQELDFSKFEYLQNQIGDILSESNFYIKLIDAMNKDLFDDKGIINTNGYTTAGLHMQNYETYMKQADEYAEKIKSINNDLANDPLDQTLIDKKKEYIEAQRESILSAQEERDAVKNLIQDAYNKQLESLKKIIDEYKKMVDVQKDAYDYEKNIREKTNNISSLQKQLGAYEGDTSESTKKTIQQLKDNLIKAQEDLQETQYDRLISDTNKLLDDLQENYQDFIDQRMDNIDEEFRILIGEVTESKDAIKESLNTLSEDNKLALSDTMNDVWNTANPITSLDANVKNIVNVASGTTSAIDNLKEAVSGRLDKMLEAIKESVEDSKTENNNANINGGVNNNTSNSTGTVTVPSTTPIGSGNGIGTVPSNTPSADGFFVYKKSYYPKGELNKETSIVDRLAWHDYDPSFEARSFYYRKMGGSGEYTASYDQNVWMLDWMKSHGYAKGSKKITKGQIALTQEKGQELIFSSSDGSMLTPLNVGDKVFTHEMSENLWSIAKSPDLYKAPIMTNNHPEMNTNVNFGDVTLSFPNIKNYEEFMKQAQNDSRFASMVQNITLGQAMGSNSLNRLRFV